jgi:ariadne-2
MFIKNLLNSSLDLNFEQEAMTEQIIQNLQINDDSNDLDNNLSGEDNQSYFDDFDYSNYNDEDLVDNYDDDDAAAEDPEYYEFKIYHRNKLNDICAEKIKILSELLNLHEKSIIMNLLKKYKWNIFEIREAFEKNENFFKENLINDANNNTDNNVNDQQSGSALSLYNQTHTDANKQQMCSICYDSKSVNTEMNCLECLHLYCNSCWKTYFSGLIKESNTSQFECMHSKCQLNANESFLYKILNNETKLCEDYKNLLDLDLIKSSADLRKCPNSDCEYLIWAKPAARRVVCYCSTQYCFLCTNAYHSPNSCDIIRKWNKKCQDDSETRNYLLVHTQDCPKCKVCIEKNGGCAHMTCYHCKHEFCWVCANDWKTHGATYDCNRYKTNSQQDEAREALNRYTHYYHRWINHANSLKFEKAFKEKCNQRINEKIMDGTCGTLIDWDFFIEAADTLTKARYTLQYTYPYAYYLDNNELKLVFENIQAELEREVENLSHSLEKVDLNDKYMIRTQMSIVEKRRKTLLNDFVN